MTEEQIKRVLDTKESLFKLLDKELGLKGNWDIKRIGDTLELRGWCRTLPVPECLKMVISGCEFSAEIRWKEDDEECEYSSHIEVGPIIIDLTGWSPTHTSGYFCPSCYAIYLFYLPDGKSDWEMRVGRRR